MMNYKGHDPRKWPMLHRGREISIPWGERARIEVYGRRVSPRRSVVTEYTRANWHHDGEPYWSAYLADEEEVDG